MDRTDDREALYRVAYDEAVRALGEQQALIESLRARAGLLLSAAAIATSFLGSQALARGGAAALAWVAVLCFLSVAAAAALAILWPRESLFGADPALLIRDYAESPEPRPVSLLHRDLSLSRQRDIDQCRRIAGRLGLLLQFGSGLFAIEILLWVAALASSF